MKCCMWRNTNLYTWIFVNNILYSGFNLEKSWHEGVELHNGSHFLKFKLLIMNGLIKSMYYAYSFTVIHVKYEDNLFWMVQISTSGPHCEVPLLTPCMQWWSSVSYDIHLYGLIVIRSNNVCSFAIRQN